MSDSAAVRTVYQLDVSGARRGLEDLGRTHQRTAGEIDARSRQTERGLEGIGQAAQRGAQLGARAMQGMNLALGAMTAATAAHEKQWLQLGQFLMLSFAAGGPVGLAVAGLGTLV